MRGTVLRSAPRSLSLRIVEQQNIRIPPAIIRLAQLMHALSALTWRKSWSRPLNLI